ncbi:HNH endonuclease signature motif containing protein [Sinorhizobium meliloti]|uniref:HNH endonuclease signature motif containing protein n=1 Tax=Rhizobium meliloti TaxID=382 RepID=UPI00398D31EA
MAYDAQSLIERLDRNSMPEPNSGCQIWLGRSRNKYGHGQMGVGGRGIMAHRVAWMCHVGPIPDGLLVLHRCDTPGCVNHRHLFLGTHQDNQADKVRKGRQARGEKLSHPRASGEKNGNSKLTAEQVLLIRELREPQRVTVSRFGVSQALISKIKRNEMWSNV